MQATSLCRAAIITCWSYSKVNRFVLFAVQVLSFHVPREIYKSYNFDQCLKKSVCFETIMSDNKKKRGKRASSHQMETIITFISKPENSVMLTGRTSPMEVNALEKKWTELSECLNGLPGARKDTKQWKAVSWISHDLKLQYIIQFRFLVQFGVYQVIFCIRVK